MNKVALKRISSEPVLYFIAGIIAVGGFASAVLTTDPRWMTWHFSRLGEGDNVAALVFNVSSAMAALLMGEFARRAVKDLGIIKAPQAALARAQSLLGRSMGVMAVCMMGIAVFPFDKFPAVHNVFGYSLTLAFVYLIARMPVLLPMFSRRFVALNYTFIVLTGMMFGFYFATGGEGLPLITIEILALMFFFIWMIVLVRNIRVHNRQL